MRITGHFAAISTASSEVNASRPTAAPGEASMPVASFVSFFKRLGIEHRVQQLIELRGATRWTAVFFVDQTFVHHLDRDCEPRPDPCACRCGSAACTACRPATVNSKSCMSL